MIELTEAQVRALERAREPMPHVVNPRTGETFVLLRLNEYDRLTEKVVDYDDRPWAREELQALAWEISERTDWENINEYDDLNEQDNEPG